MSTASLAELAETYEVDEIRTEPLGPRYNVAPSQPIYAVAARRRSSEKPSSDDGAGRQTAGEPTETGLGRVLGTFRWGLVPSWAKDRSIGNKLINARSEGIATKPAFRSALLRRRCIIPAESFYEWQVQAPGPKGQRGRLPYVIRRCDRRTLSLAGLWEVWRDPTEPDAPLLRTATIVTTAANEVLSSIHSRMPVVLPDELVGAWLDPEVVDADFLTGLLVPAPDDWWETWAVSTRVNAVVNEGPELVEPLPPAPR